MRGQENYTKRKETAKRANERGKNKLAHIYIEI